MNERLEYAIKRLQNEPHALVYEGADATLKRGGGRWFVYPSIHPQPMHTLTKNDLNYLLRHDWIAPLSEYWFRRGVAALIYAPEISQENAELEEAARLLIAHGWAVTRPKRS